MKRIVFATNNAHKLDEIRGILGQEFAVVSLEELGCHDEIPETAATLEGNALQKARYIHDRYRVDCFADDTGLEVEALDGGPGIYTARFGVMNNYGTDHDAEANTRCLLDKLKGAASRKAQFRTAIALVLDGKEHLFEGVAKGTITEEKRGEKGFGYDPVFVPEGYDQTFAELGVEAKNRISHRAKAVMKLAAFLKNEK
jgi:XTP/dITP diphosphohydrolase